MIQVPLEIHGMVRACRPITPSVGLTRQSRDPKRTKINYEEARKIRDTVCFPSMLREATERCLGYKALRRLWIQTLVQFLQIHQYKYFIIQTIVDYLPEEPERIPLYFSKHDWSLDYDSLSPSLRMEQLAGKLHALGYPRMVLPEPDYELEGYMILAEDEFFVEDLYQELKRKKIVDKWHIMSSWIQTRNRPIDLIEKQAWLQFCQQNKLTLYLNACIRVNPLSQEEIELLHHWENFMKYPNR